MANLEMYGDVTSVPEGVEIPISFAPNGAGAVDNTQNRGKRVIQSVTRTGVGVFDVILKHSWDGGLIAVNPSIQLSADADTTLSSWNYVAATRTLTLRFRTAGAAADIAANAANRLGVVLYTQQSKGLTY